MRYMAHLSGGGNSIGPLITADGNRYASNEREAREALRAWLKVDRLPNGTEIYPTT